MLPEPSSAARLERRRLYQVSAVMVLGFVLQDPFVDRFRPSVLALRVAWSLVLLGCGFLLARAQPWAYHLAVRIAGFGSGVCLGAICWIQGGTTGPVAYWLPALPLAALILAQEDLWGIATVAVATHAVLLAMGLSEGLEGMRLFAWQSTTGASTLLALLASREYGRRMAAEQQALSRLRDSEQRRANSERLATVGRLAAGVAHEINNPLAFVKGNVAALRDELQGGSAGDPNEVRAILDEMEQGAERIRRIVLDLKTFAREETGDPLDPVPVADVVDESLRLASTRMKPSVLRRAEVAPGCPRAALSPSKLGQVLVNLLLNASDALEKREGGEVTVRVGPERDGVAFTVEDNGPGFPADVLPHLFEPFVTSKAPRVGTGLGLAMSHELVAQVGGSMAAENRVEGGARLRFWLPAVAAGAQQVSGAAP